MAETLMSLVIGGVLMLALGSAVVIFVNSTTSNRDYVASVQAARLSLLRMGAVVRKCNSCQVGETAPTAGSQTVTGTVLKVIPATGTAQAYRYQTFQGRKELRYYPDATKAFATDSDIQVNSSRMAANVTDMKFTGEVDASMAFINVQMVITVGSGDAKVALSDSVVPRQELVVH